MLNPLFIKRFFEIFPDMTSSLCQGTRVFKGAAIRQSLMAAPLKTLVQIRLARCQSDLLIVPFHRIFQRTLFLFNGGVVFSIRDTTKQKEVNSYNNLVQLILNDEF